MRFIVRGRFKLRKMIQECQITVEYNGSQSEGHIIKVFEFAKKTEARQLPHVIQGDLAELGKVAYPQIIEGYRAVDPQILKGR